MKRNHKSQPVINASSMADVAFLLLIFFLVVTTIETDKGIRVMLPPWCEDCPPPPVPTSQLLSINVNGLDKLLVNGDEQLITDLKYTTKEYIRSKGKKTVISLRNDRSTSYEAYLSVYNELKAAFNEVWEEESTDQYGISYKELNGEKKKDIRSRYPLVISEAESSDFAISR